MLNADASYQDLVDFSRSHSLRDLVNDDVFITCVLEKTFDSEHADDLMLVEDITDKFHDAFSLSARQRKQITWEIMRQQRSIRAMYEQCLRQGPRSLEEVLPVPYSTSHASMGLSGLYPTQVRGRPRPVGTSVMSDSVQAATDAGDRTPRAMSEPPGLTTSETSRPLPNQALSLQTRAPPWDLRVSR